MVLKDESEGFEATKEKKKKKKKMKNVKKKNKEFEENSIGGFMF